MNKDNGLNVHWLVKVIIGLIIIMLILVVHDRYVFHSKVYCKAISEVAVLEQAIDSCSSLCKCRHCIDSIAKSQIRSSSVGATNTNNIRQTVNVNDNSDSLSEMIEDTSSLFTLIKDVDGLISANGITFLISLIVAILIALVTDRIGAMEKLSAALSMTKEGTEQALKNNEKLQKEMQDSLNESMSNVEKIRKSNEQLQEDVRQFLIETGNKRKELYNHFAIYDMLLSKVESLFNLAITIGSVTKFMSLPNVNNVDKDSLYKNVGILCSRLSLLCDSIEDILNGRERKIEHLSEDEKNILLTYLADAQDELERSRGEVKSNQFLYNIIGNNIRMVYILYDMIEAIE